MAIEIYGAQDIQRLRKAGRIAAETLAAVTATIGPGMSTAAIDAFVREDTARRGAVPSQLGYHGFPASVCTSRNDVVCHGIPSVEEILDSGDILNVDVTSYIGGFHGDTSRTVCVGVVTPEAQHVVQVAERCRDAGIAAVRAGARLGDVASVIVELAKKEGCSVVRELGGHGIGREMHTDPHVPHVGRRGKGVRLRSGMALTIEPMINLGGAGVAFSDDGWTVTTRDGSLSAQFEHTVLVTDEGCEILT